MFAVGPIYPTAITQWGAAVLSWSNLSNGTADDGDEATCVLILNQSKVCQAEFNFTLSEFPGASVLVGLVLEIKRRSIGGSSDRVLNLSLVDGVAGAGDDKADTVTVWPGAAAYKSYGSSSDKWDATFVIASLATVYANLVAEDNSGGLGSTAAVDTMRLTAYYDVVVSPVPAQSPRHRSLRARVRAR